MSTEWCQLSLARLPDLSYLSENKQCSLTAVFTGKKKLHQALFVCLISGSHGSKYEVFWDNAMCSLTEFD
jgi:hypothetical protein